MRSLVTTPLRRSPVIIATLLCALILLVPPSTLGAGRDQVFRIATASKSGTFYPVGKLIAEGISGSADCDGPRTCGIPGQIAVAQTSNGSVANVQAVSDGTVEAALAQADVIYWAHRATGRFAGRSPMTELRALANLFPGSLHIVTSAGSSIRRVAELEGRRVALDEPGSGTLATAELILSSVGIDKADLTALYVKHNHAAPMLETGQLDAFFFVAGHPTQSVLDLSRRVGIHLVPLDPETVASLVAERPYFAEGMIPADAYPGLTSDALTVDIGTQLIVNASLDEQLAYDITAALWNSRTRKLLDEGHEKGAQIRLETALKGIAVPLHPGAARYYREIGLRKD